MPASPAAGMTFPSGSSSGLLAGVPAAGRATFRERYDGIHASQSPRSPLLANLGGALPARVSNRQVHATSDELLPRLAQAHQKGFCPARTTVPNFLDPKPDHQGLCCLSFTLFLVGFGASDLMLLLRSRNGASACQGKHTWGRGWLGMRPDEQRRDEGKVFS